MKVGGVALKLRAEADHDGPLRPMFRLSLRRYFGEQFTLCLIFGGADASHDA